MESYLEKLGEIVKNWKRRFFVLYPEKCEIAYYADSEKTAVIGTISLTNAIVTTFSVAEFNRHFVFGITPAGNNRTYILCCDSELLLNQWMEKIAPKMPISQNISLKRDPILSGYLMKEGGVVKSWKKRYFELYKSLNEIQYYEDDKKTECLGKISLVDVNILPSMDGFEQSFCFGVAGGGLARTYVLAGETDAIRKEWVTSISELIQILADSKSAKNNQSHSVFVAQSFGTLPHIVKAGWLLKLGENVKNWKRRWCIVTGPMLFYYESPEDDQLKPKGRVNLLGGRVTHGVEIEDEFEKSNLLCFTGANTQRRYVFICETAQECHDWIAVLTSCCTAKGVALLQQQVSGKTVEELDLTEFSDTAVESEDEEKANYIHLRSHTNSAISYGGTLSQANLVGSLSAMEHGNQKTSALDNLKQAVSKQKRRFVDENFNLDLTYITDRIIAMGFPADNFEGMFRNSMEDVQRFFEMRHKGHYKVYNLCSERMYDASKFQGRVMHFPFDDHNCPNFDDMEVFCKDVAKFLLEDPLNIVAIHCKAGKGRTGLMIAVFMLFANVWETPQQALSYYAFARTKNMKGVTIASQIRVGKYLPPAVPKRLVRMVIGPKAPEFDSVKITNQGVVYTSNNHFPKFWKRELPDGGHELFCGDGILLCKDFCITFIAKKYFGASKSTVFGAWVNTQFIENNYNSLSKKEIDKVCKQKNAHDFKWELFYESTKPELEKEHEVKMAEIEEKVRSRDMLKRLSSLPEIQRRESINIGRVDIRNVQELEKKLEEIRYEHDVDDSEDEEDRHPSNPISPIVSSPFEQPAEK